MNLERRINKLNRLLRTELGGQVPRLEAVDDVDQPGGGAPLAWLSTDSPLLEHPAEVWERGSVYEQHKPVHDYWCSCGKNVRVHTPECKTLTKAVVRGEMCKVFPDHPHCWVLSTVRPTKPWEAMQLRMFGREPGLLWCPLGIDTLPRGYLITEREPTEDQTWMVIRGLREFRSKTTREWMEHFREIVESQEHDSRMTARGIAREQMGISLHPGQKNGVSFPNPDRQGVSQ